MHDLPLMMAAGFVAGTMNAVAGGGSFISFPAMVFAGLPSVVANASSTVALFPGAVASASVYRHDLGRIGGMSIWLLLALSLAGGLAGAVLLLVTPQATFDALVPWLLLLAMLTFAFGRQVGPMLRRHVHIGRAPLLALQFLLGIYGGYFGGAVGIMMLAVWTLLGSEDIKRMNAGRVVLVGATNAVAVLCFVAAGKVWWPETLAMLVAAVAGGYGGARVARLLSPRTTRVAILCVTGAITLAFFVRRYFA
jgi:uncharacterized membrane protein YfcA